MSAVAIRADDFKPVLDVIVLHARSSKVMFDIILRGDSKKDRWLEAAGEVEGLEEALKSALGNAVSVEAVK